MRLRYLLQRVAGSMAQRGWRGTIKRAAQEFQTRAPQDPEWTLESLETAFTPFSLPHDDVPQVSVIIPTYGKLPYTLACLRSIASHPALAAIEIIAVDDASPDESASTLAKVGGLRLLRNQHNLGFIGSCNAAAAVARGQYLLFLNNDTQVTEGWLDRLLDCFSEETNCGIVGSRLAYPDGRLQEAGGLVYSNGKAWNYGRFESRDDPRFLYRREVDYITGAALMIDAALFRSVGGFDSRYAPAYCEDLDLAFAVRAAGKRVIYQPASLVIHCEGVSSGTDPFAGVKQYQIANHAKFMDKWQRQLANQPAPETPVDTAIHHRDERHILIVDALTPDPTRDSGSQRLVNIMQILHELGWRVSFMADNRSASISEINQLGRYGVRTLCKPRDPTLNRWLAREGRSLNAVMLCRHYIAQPNLSLVRHYAPDAKLLFDTVDLHFLREQRAAKHTGNTALAHQAKASQKHELALIRAFDTSLVVSQVELDLLRSELPGAHVELLTNIHEVFGCNEKFSARHGLVFIGGFGHPPNEDAVRWLITDVFPRIHLQRPDIELHVIGDMPDTARQELTSPGVYLHGRVADLTEWMNSCRISLAPLRYGAGVKGKINMAMSYGLPVVATPIAVEGMYTSDGQTVLLGETSEDLAAATLRLYDDESLWNQLSAGGLKNIRDHFSFDAARETLRRILP